MSRELSVLGPGDTGQCALAALSSPPLAPDSPSIPGSRAGPGPNPLPYLCHLDSQRLCLPARHAGGSCLQGARAAATTVSDRAPHGVQHRVSGQSRSPSRTRPRIAYAFAFLARSASPRTRASEYTGDQQQHHGEYLLCGGFRKNERAKMERERGRGQGTGEGRGTRTWGVRKSDFAGQTKLILPKGTIITSTRAPATAVSDAVASLPAPFLGVVASVLVSAASATVPVPPAGAEVGAPPDPTPDVKFA